MTDSDPRLPLDDANDGEKEVSKARGNKTQDNKAKNKAEANKATANDADGAKLKSSKTSHVTHHQTDTGESVAQQIRTRRAKIKLTLETVAEELKIRRIYLDALEEERYRDLPDPVYAAGFVRSYLAILGFNDAEIKQMSSQFQAEAFGTRHRKKQDLSFPDPIDTATSPSKKAVYLSVFLLVAGIIATMIMMHGGDDTVPVTPPLPLPDNALSGVAPIAADMMEQDPAADIAVIVDPETSPNVDVTGMAADEGTESAEGEDSGLTQNTGASLADVNGAPVENTAATDMAMAEPTAIPEDADTSSNAEILAPTPDVIETSDIDLFAIEDSWIEITDQNGRVLISQILPSGRLYNVPKRDGLRLTIGNAGGVRVIVQGERLPLLGREGQVRRNIPLNASRLMRLRNELGGR